MAIVDLRNKVAQVITGETTSSITTTSSTYIDTQLDLTITPKFINSAIIVTSITYFNIPDTVNLALYADFELNKNGIQVKRTLTGLDKPAGQFFVLGTNVIIEYYDTHSTMAPINYKVRGRVQVSDGSLRINNQAGNYVPGTMKLMEVIL